MFLWWASESDCIVSIIGKPAYCINTKLVIIMLSPTSHAVRSLERPLPPLAAVLYRAAATVADWEERHRTRKALKRLDDRMLRDIGLTAAHRAAECGKGFWQP